MATASNALAAADTNPVERIFMMRSPRLQGEMCEPELAAASSLSPPFLAASCVA
jgi:hypothetical protein